MADDFNEKELIAMLQDKKQNEKAFNQVVLQFQQQIYWQIRKMVLTHDDANDVMQNTFIKAWKGLKTFRGDAKLSTWLYRIAVNESLTFISKQRNQNIGADPEDILLNKMEADAYFDGDELQLKLQQAVMSLPEKQRLVFNMKYFDDMKYDEIEGVLGTSVGALKASYHLAVKKIETFFKQEE